MDKLITHPSDLFVVVCRPALPKDTTDVMVLTRDIWEGNDYVPYVWAEWLSDADSLLAVAEYGGHVVGLAHLAWKGSGEWWLQGLRVHPDYQGRGIASRLHDYILDAWQRRQGEVLRLATSSARLPVHHLCERTGFTLVGEFRKYAAPALSGASAQFRPVLAGEAAEALQAILCSPLFATAHQLLYLDWYWGELTAGRFAEIIRRGDAYWWLGDGGRVRGLLGIDVDTDDEQGSHPFIQVLACEHSDLSALLADYRRLGQALGYERAEWLAPEIQSVGQALMEAGYASDWENALYLFEKRR